MNKSTVTCLFFTLALSVNALATTDAIDKRLQPMLEKSMGRLACNLSPKWVKTTPSGDIVPAKGSVLGARHKDDPDYYFHWIRDSSMTVVALVDALPFFEKLPASQRVHEFMRDFISFTDKIQRLDNSHGLGDPRYNVDGTLDTIFWSRPQFDGPSLRALALMAYFKSYGDRLEPLVRMQLLEVIKRDLDYIAKVHDDANFDLWEYFYGKHFHARLTMLGALEEGLALFPHLAGHDWATASKTLKSALKGHWDPEVQFYKFATGELRNPEGGVVPQPGQGLDSSLILAATGSRRGDAELSIWDDKMLVSVWKLEKFYRENFPMNRSRQLGPALGRHPGDGYYGGLAWYFTTNGASELYFRLAEHYASRKTTKWIVSELNKAYLTELLGRPLKLGENVIATKKKRSEVVARIKAKGEAFLTTVLDVTPANGMMGEQIHKEDGRPMAAEDLSWSYGGFLGAVVARERVARSSVDFSKITMACTE